jgi:hypothetical protein
MGENMGTVPSSQTPSKSGLTTPSITSPGSTRPVTPSPSLPSSDGTPQELSPSKVASLYFSYLLSYATPYISSAQVSSDPKPSLIGIAIPDDWSEEKRLQVKNVFDDMSKSLGVEVPLRTEIFGTREAILRAYEGLDSSIEEEKKIDKNVLLLDLGSSGLGLNIVEARGGLYTSKKSERFTKLSGKLIGSDQILHILYNHFSKDFHKKSKLTLPKPSSIPSDPQELRSYLKLLLTLQTVSIKSLCSTVSVESLMDGYDYSGGFGTTSRLRWDGTTGSWWEDLVGGVKEWVGDEHIDEVRTFRPVIYFPNETLK